MIAVSCAAVACSQGDTGGAGAGGTATSGSSAAGRQGGGGTQAGSGSQTAASGTGGGTGGVAAGSASAGSMASGSGGTATVGGGDAGGAGASGSAGAGGGSGAGGAGGASGAGSGSPAAMLAARLGRSHFLIGMGNDLADDHEQDGAYTLGVDLDIHYAYLVGLLGMGGWPDWNADGSFVDILAAPAMRRGVVPMYTLYAMAAWGEANLSVLTNDDYMGPYWDGAKLLFERLGGLDGPSIVHIEPDFWAFAQQQQGGDPTAIDVHVGALVSDCTDQPDDLTGFGHCLLELAHTYAPDTVVAFHASAWANPDPTVIASYLAQVGAADADIIAVDMLDRDAGCFEAHVDPNCQRNDGPWYWDETNQTSPNFHEHLAWAQAVSEGLGHKPILWWQVPFGVPSDTPGGSAGAYRDNRVKYIFEHVDELVAAGGLGAAFGVGAENQTYITTDGGQFQSAVTAYYADPTPL